LNFGIDGLHCLKVAIDDPRRFPRSRERRAHFGLTPQDDYPQ
jgi:hypothetical protein